MWQVTVMAYGDEEIADGISAPTLGDALVRGLDDLGFSENDEGSYTIQVNGAAD